MIQYPFINVIHHIIFSTSVITPTGDLCAIRTEYSFLAKLSVCMGHRNQKETKKAILPGNLLSHSNRKHRMLLEKFDIPKFIQSP